MKTEDFHRLKAVCEKEGFELLNESASDNDKFFVVKKSDDIWKDVEFAEFTRTKQIHKVKSKTETHIISQNGPTRWKCEFNPSTESEYIEQLKAECFKRFGEIKEGDRFEDINEIISIVSGPKPTFIYNKEYDQLFYGQVTLYQAGKWATRVKERVKVEWHSIGDDVIVFKYSGKINVEGRKFFLASKLEEYLNKE